MSIEPILPENKADYNAVISHPLQSYEWGEFREKTGVKVIRRGIVKEGKIHDGFQLTIHPIPKTSYTIGYLPKGNLPNKAILDELKRIGKEENCLFIQLEPNIVKRQMHEGAWKTMHEKDLPPELISSAHPLFTKYTFSLDLTRSEEEILKAMHQKTRYNIKVAQKHNVLVTEDNSPDAFVRYWELTEETTKRQKFYAHTKKYHELQWETFNQHSDKRNPNVLTSHLLTARVEGKILTTMLFFVFKDTLYYPYGASSNEARNTMHSVLTMWEGIRLGKKLGLQRFDMWGSLSDTPNPNDSWYGFHRFKQGFGPDLIEFIGSYDLVVNPMLYQLYKVADKVRWMYLKIKK